MLLAVNTKTITKRCTKIDNLKLNSSITTIFYFTKILQKQLSYLIFVNYYLNVIYWRKYEN